MTDSTQELDELLQRHFRGYAARSFPEYQGNASEIWDSSVEKAKQAILDWHNKQTEALLNELLVDVSSPSARIDQAEMIELINLYINKLKENLNESN